jgi:hypothetical protein
VSLLGVDFIEKNEVRTIRCKNFQTHCSYQCFLLCGRHGDLVFSAVQSLYREYKRDRLAHLVTEPR